MGRRRAPTARRALALLMAGALAVAITLAMRPGPRRILTEPVSARVFPRIDLQDARSPGTLPTLGLSGTHFIVVYVADSCRASASELARWDSIISSDRGRLDNVKVTVIRAGGRALPTHRAAFADRELVDARGEVARALRIDAVPTSFVLAADGTIIGHRVGQAGPRAMQQFLARAIQGGGP